MGAEDFFLEGVLDEAMGTPAMSAEVLTALLAADFKVIGLVCQEDKPLGRDKVAEVVPTKAVALAHQIPVFQPHKIRLDFEFAKTLDFDVIVTMAYGQIIPQGLLDLAKVGCVNLHEDPYLLLPSPFPKENFDLLLAPMVSTRYKDRSKTYSEVARYLASFVAGKLGNYFLYFPSYEYLENIQPFLNFPNANVFTQEKEMSDEEKSLFLSRFLSHPEKTTIGLLIIGGSFSEGIDLVEDRLIGVAVVGIGLPQLSHVIPEQ